MRKLGLIGFLALALSALFVNSASATSITYNLTSDHCTGGCGTSPFGSVTLNDFGSTGDVRVMVTLFNGNQFVDTGFAGAFGFNLLGNPTISVTGLPSGFALVSSTAATGNDYHFDGLGYFDYAISGPSPSHPYSGPLTFDVLAAGLTVASFADLSRTPADEQAYFVADILSGQTGRTGPVGSLGPCLSGCTQQLIENPEPASLILFGTGLLIGVSAIRKFGKPA